MKTAKVYLNDGTNYTTSINGTDKEIKEYFLNKWFNVGYADKDIMRLCINVEVV